MKGIRVAITGIAVAVCAGILCACGSGGKQQLASPTGLTVGDDDILRWTAIDNATGYCVEIDGERYETESNSFDVFEITSECKTYTIRVKTYGSLRTNIDSEWSKEIEYTVSDSFRDGLGYAIVNDGTEVSVKALKPELLVGKVVIPSEMFGLPVTQMAVGYGFANCDKMTGIIVPDSVTQMSVSMFRACTNLIRAKISKSLTIVPTYTFSGCSSLQRVTLPSTADMISNNAFEGCSRLESIVLPENLDIISYNAFTGCSSLKSIEIPESVTAIRNNAFSFCSSLTSIYIPKNVDVLCQVTNSDLAAAASIVRGCSSLESIEVAADNAKYSSDGNCIIRKSDNTVIGGCKNSVIPEYAERIEDGLSYIDGVTTLYIPASVEYISSRAFIGMSDLESITVAQDNRVYASDGNCIIRKEDEAVVLGCKASEIPEYVKSIDTRAFSAFSSLKTITLPEGLTEIGVGAFLGSGLQSISIPSSITTIKMNAFRECADLKNVEFAEGITEIGNYAFYMSGVESIALPNSLLVIDPFAFAHTPLKELYLPNIYADICNSAFYDVELSSVTIPVLLSATDWHIFSGNFDGITAYISPLQYPRDFFSLFFLPPFQDSILFCGCEIVDDERGSYVYSFTCAPNDPENNEYSCQIFFGEPSSEWERRAKNPAPPTRYGYNFVGWTTSEWSDNVEYVSYGYDVTREVYVGTLPSGEVTDIPYGTKLYSVWEKK